MTCNIPTDVSRSKGVKCNFVPKIVLDLCVIPGSSVSVITQRHPKSRNDLIGSCVQSSSPVTRVVEGCETDLVDSPTIRRRRKERLSVLTEKSTLTIFHLVAQITPFLDIFLIITENHLFVNTT